MTVATLTELAEAVDDGATVALGGKTLHRGPMAFVRALARADVDDLTVLGLAKSMDVDLLCGLDRVGAVHYGYVGFEWLGLAPNFRRRAESGALDPLEGTCYTVATMLRGAKQGVPFLPIAGLDDSDLVDRNDYLDAATDPFTGDPVAAVRTVTPDVGVIHVAEADRRGNARLGGADLTEGLVARAADTVFVTAERIVDGATFDDHPERADVPAHLVDAVAEAPYGAHPLSCPGAYEYDVEHLREYLDRSAAGEADEYAAAALGDDESAYRERTVAGREEPLAWERLDRRPSTVGVES